MAYELGEVASVVALLENPYSLVVMLWRRSRSARLKSSLSWAMVWSVLVSLRQSRRALFKRSVHLSFSMAAQIAV